VAEHGALPHGAATRKALRLLAREVAAEAG